MAILLRFPSRAAFFSTFRGTSEGLGRIVTGNRKLMVLTGAGVSTECGIPDYRRFYLHFDLSPMELIVLASNQLPISSEIDGHSSLEEFVRSSRTRRRYWARSYAGWRRFTAAQPGAAHIALASLERAARINFVITQNVDRLHHCAGSNPLELHGTVYDVVCLDCGFSSCRNFFQEQVKELNPKWAAAIESLDYGSPGSDKSFGMKQRPDGDIEIDEKFWEEDFHIPTCKKCNGVLKPDVVFFGDNVPKDRADKAMEAAKGCDAFLVLGSSLMTMSAYRLVRLIFTSYMSFTSKAAYEAGAATAIVNVGVTRADDFVGLRINARVGEILPRVLDLGSLGIPAFL
ncbi:NAD-dependent protein deacetylase SRT2 [Morella rubra]|uniref:NAD-dependent protein deacetylase SRT2 n=1 Tax=Morella rubra TaxID=262757 RepID=A0A6A1VCV1_9ROSI|nr:NAD-dependent protein deacetylase SRT2 [Morella rubra]